MMPPEFRIIFIPQLKQSEAPSHLCSEAYLQLAVLTIIPPRFNSCRGWLDLFGEEAVFNCSVVFSSRNSGTLLAISISLYQTNSPNLRSNSFFQFPRSNLNPLHDSCLMSMTHKDVWGLLRICVFFALHSSWWAKSRSRFRGPSFGKK